MPKISKVAEKVQLEVERFDGGLNTKDSPSRISTFESPDCQNVVFDDQGSVVTRQGTGYFSTSISQTTDTTAITHNIEMGLNKIDGLQTYKGTMVAWSAGNMLRASGTTWVTVPSSVGQFSSGVAVASVVYQNVLFCSDGTNGPWRYQGGSDFYNMGIDTPSACTGSGTSAGSIQTGTYHYKVSFVNTAAVEGEVGDASTGIAIANTSTIGLTEIPVGSSLAGIGSRFIYRSNSGVSGVYKYVNEIADNATTTYADTTTNADLAGEPEDDATSPTPFTTIALHKERLLFDDSSNQTLLRYTESGNPYVSKVLNFLALNKGDGSDITAVAVQDDFVTVFKDKSIWVVELVDAADDTSWILSKSPSNYGIVGPKAFTEINNALVFVGKLNGRISGLHMLSGLTVIDTSDEKLRTTSISEKIEPTVFGYPSTLWDDIALAVYNTRIYAAVPASSSSSFLDGIMWFDVNRIGSKGQPGSWAPWTGDLKVQNLVVHDGTLYGGSSQSDGQVIEFNTGVYTDASGKGIDSYFWTKPLGGEAAIESWVKDFRWLNLWYELVGNWNMAVRYRVDGDVGSGDAIDVDLNPGGSLWGAMVWGVDAWGGERDDYETQLSLGTLLGRRAEFRFDNKYDSASPTDSATHYFKVHALKLLMNLRAQR